VISLDRKSSDTISSRRKVEGRSTLRITLKTFGALRLGALVATFVSAYLLSTDRT
jgi:hypothetical protein